MKINFFLSISKGRTQGKQMPPRLEKQANAGMWGLQSRDSWIEAALRSSVGEGDTELWGIAKAQCTQLWANRSPGASHGREEGVSNWFCQIYLSELEKIPTINIREISSLASRWWGKEGLFWKTPEHLVFKKVCLQEKLVNKCLTAEVLSVPNSLWGREMFNSNGL